VDWVSAPTLSHYLVLGAILFAISIAGIFLNRKNVIILLMAIELMLLAVNMNFVAFSQSLGMQGRCSVFFILTVPLPSRQSASPSPVLLFRSVGSIDVEDMEQPGGLRMDVGPLSRRAGAALAPSSSTVRGESRPRGVPLARILG
jgi:NADH-quinone oxidoreductase subunit K